MQTIPLTTAADTPDDGQYQGPSEEAEIEYRRLAAEALAAQNRGEDIRPLTDRLGVFMLANGWADNGGPMDDDEADTPPAADPGTIARAMVMAAAAGDDQSVDDLHALATKGG